MANAMLEPVAPSEADIQVAKEAGPRLAKMAKSGRPLNVTTQDGDAGEPVEVVKIPQAAVPIIKQVLAAMAQGHAVSVVPINANLTTQQAATLLGVSRPFVIKLLENGEIPCRKVGKHRRIVLKDLMDYKHRSYVERQKILDELTEEGQDIGVGY